MVVNPITLAHPGDMDRGRESLGDDEVESCGDGEENNHDEWGPVNVGQSLVEIC